MKRERQRESALTGLPSPKGWAGLDHGVLCSLHAWTERVVMSDELVDGGHGRGGCGTCRCAAFGRSEVMGGGWV